MGGEVVLPAMELVLDRGLILRSGVELCGQGEQTVLVKGPGKVYPLSGYHNYGMCDVPLVAAEGLEVGMTVSVHDGRSHGGFMETFATITWIDGDWVGLDHGIEMDYYADKEPCLTTVYPLVFAHYIQDAAVRNMRLEGNRAANEKAMGGCRGGAVYFGNSRGIEITGIRERDFWGEGLSFQMCRDVKIIDCAFDENTGNGRSGFFFCVRANHITVRDCSFRDNALGISLGTRDCYNLIENCRMEGNRGAGVLVRQTPKPTEVHSCRVQKCQIKGNARVEGQGQVEITSDARDLVFVENEVGGERDKPGVFVEQTARSIYLSDNVFTDCKVEVEMTSESRAEKAPEIECGYGEWPAPVFRHLLA